MISDLTAIVSGGSEGIGLSISRRLIERNIRVVSLTDRSGCFTHENFIEIKVDLTDREQTLEACGKIKDFSPTILVCNAGFVKSALLEDVELEDLDALNEIFIAGSISTLQACLPAMKRASFGRVILISSRAAVGLESRTCYSAAKSGQFGLARTWALELGRYGITVNVVAPGPISTRMFTDVVPTGSEKENALIETIPMRRIGTTEDIAKAVNYFSDTENSFVTGQILYVCGGTSVGTLQI
ncbi:MAG: SDR family oxidoreductase [Pseudomonadales bacterium]